MQPACVNIPQKRGRLVSSLEAAASATPSLPVGWVITLAVASLIFGGGGVAALLKAINDRKQGVEAHEITEDDAIAARWQALSDAQVKNLLRPMEARLATVESEVEKLKEELATSRAKYWRAIAYIRTLLAWISRHTVFDAATPIPDPPAILVEDI